MPDGSQRPYDVVLYGATGFTGRQTVRYFAQQAKAQPVRWAIAGRDRAKLDAIKAESGAAVDVLVADSGDQAAVDQMVGQTQVVLNTAGPFALYGTAIVDACVRSQTHYVDITGETAWVKRLIDRYHAAAAATGTRIIPFCGFDSVPSDLGTYLLVRQMQRQLGQPCRAVKAYFQAAGGFNGGTLASGFNLYESGDLQQVGDPFLLSPPQAHSQREREQSQDPTLPHYDADINAWTAPFFMGAINTRVVRRSQALYQEWQEPYGPEFTYQEYMKFEGPLAGLQAAGMTGTMALFAGAMQLDAVRGWLKSVLPQPGSGPSEQTMNDGWFRCELLGMAADGQRLQGVICDRGDPGNRATVKFLCESALCLAQNQEELPGGPQRGGVLTPATGLGEVLAQRLQQAGMQIAMGDSER